MSSSSGRVIDESYTMPTGKRSERRVVGSELTLPLRDGNGANAELILRAHDDGVAFRYHLLGEGDSEVMSESTGFSIPDGASGTRVLTRPYDGGDAIFAPSAGGYEMPPEIWSLGQAIDRTGFAFPTLFEIEQGDKAAIGKEYVVEKQITVHESFRQRFTPCRIQPLSEAGQYIVEGCCWRSSF